MTDCALPCFMFTCVPSGNVKLIPDIGSAASAKPSAPSAITGRNIEPVVSEDGSSRSYLALFWDSRICLFASPTLSPRACIHLVMPRWYTWISLRKEVRRTFESWLSRTRYFFHAHSYRSSAVILLKILIWRQRYNDKRTCTRLHRGYAYNFQMRGIAYVGRILKTGILVLSLATSDATRTKYSHQTTIPTDIVILITHECGGCLLEQFAHVFIKFQFYHSL